MTRIALVTGASGGIGRSTADLLAARGWTVIGASRRGTGGEAWQGLGMDVDDDDSVASGVAEVLHRHGRIDAVVAAAGWGLAGPVETTSTEEAKAQGETLFWGVVRVGTAVLPSMRARGGGRVVAVGSIGGLLGLPFQAYYSAAKFALEGWAEAMAYEVEPFGIQVTVVEPGNVCTDFTANRRRAGADPGSYAVAMERALGVMELDEAHGVSPAVVARVVVEQLESRRPRRRVSVGKGGERIGVGVKRLLPHRWFEALAKGSLGVD
jgi:NAD(P)-dependent dehydrogenase (short-subunit alcohol dehydrogenase family)